MASISKYKNIADTQFDEVVGLIRLAHEKVEP